MEQKTIGKFISTLRKANGYTQQQVADFLCVSNKTVSKWERDEGYPEITMLPAIAELYGVTVDEILKGERIENPLAENIVPKIEERRKLLLEKTTLKFKNFCIVSMALGVSSSLFSFFFSYNLGYGFWEFATALAYVILIASIIVLVVARNNYISALNSEDIEPEVLDSAKSNVRRYIYWEIVFIMATIAGTAMNFDGDLVLAMAILTVIILVVVSILLNKYNKF